MVNNNNTNGNNNTNPKGNTTMRIMSMTVTTEMVDRGKREYKKAVAMFRDRFGFCGWGVFTINPDYDDGFLVPIRVFDTKPQADEYASCIRWEAKPMVSEINEFNS